MLLLLCQNQTQLHISKFKNGSTTDLCLQLYYDTSDIRILKKSIYSVDNTDNTVNVLTLPFSFVNLPDFTKFGINIWGRFLTQTPWHRVPPDPFATPPDCAVLEGQCSVLQCGSAPAGQCHAVMLCQRWNLQSLHSKRCSPDL